MIATVEVSWVGFHGKFLHPLETRLHWRPNRDPCRSSKPYSYCYQYDFDIQYCPDSTNQKANKLSWLPSMDYQHLSHLLFPGLVFCVPCSSHWICMALRMTHLRASAIGELCRGTTKLSELCTDTSHKQRPFTRGKILRYAPYFGSVSTLNSSEVFSTE